MIGICNTDGRGYWSTVIKPVAITRLELDQIEEGQFGELRAYFDESKWSIRNDGYIYTDRTWLDEFRNLLYTKGFSADACNDVAYSEQGMQGTDYVSMDVGSLFIEECDPLYNFTNGQSPKTVDIKITVVTDY